MEDNASDKQNLYIVCYKIMLGKGFNLAGFKEGNEWFWKTNIIETEIFF